LAGVNTVPFQSITSIIAWAKASVQYLAGDPNIPYVLKDGVYQYFSFNGEKYQLFATSERDLNHLEKK